MLSRLSNKAGGYRKMYGGCYRSNLYSAGWWQASTTKRMMASKNREKWATSAGKSKTSWNTRI